MTVIFSGEHEKKTNTIQRVKTGTFPFPPEHIDMKVAAQRMTGNSEKAQLTAENIAEFMITVMI